MTKPSLPVLLAALSAVCGSLPALSSQAVGSHLQDCDRRRPVAARTLLAELEKRTQPYENLNVVGDLRLRGSSGFRCDGCCFERLQVSGLSNGDLILNGCFVRGALQLGPRLQVRGGVTISHTLIDGALLLDDADVTDTVDLDGVSISGGGIRFDGVRAGALRLADVSHDAWRGGAAPVVRGDIRGIELVNTRVHGTVAVDRLEMAGFWGQLEAGGGFSWRGGSAASLQLQAARFAGPVLLEFDASPTSFGAARSQLGSEVLLRLPRADAAGVKRLDLSEAAGAFREIPDASLLVPAVVRGTPTKHLRATLVRLARAYESVGMLRDALEVRRHIAGLDFRSARSPLGRVTTGLRWIGGGEGADRRVLACWGGLLALMTVLQLLAHLGSSRPLFVPETATTPGGNTSRAKVRLALAAAASGVLPAPFELGGRLIGWSLLLFAVSQFAVWILVGLYAGTLTGYF